MKHIISYLICIIIGVMIAVFIDGTGGVMIVTALLVAVTLSSISINFVKKKITFQFDTGSVLLSKSEIAEFEVKLKKNSHIPTPFIEVGFCSSPNLKATYNEIYKISLGTNKSETLKISYNAEFSGEGFIGIEYITMTDYLSLFTFKIFKSNKQNTHISKVNILPDIPHLSPQNDLIKSVDNTLASNDSEDEKTSDNGMSIGGFAGYEHRPYVAGDPIKRINWKLSSKRDEYMVRLDERFTSSGIMIVFDCIEDQIGITSAEFLKKTDIIIESALGLAGLMLSNGLECECCFKTASTWESMDISDEKSLIELQTRFASYQITKQDTQRIPFKLLNKNKSKMAVVFTNNADESISENQKNALANECNLFYVVSDTEKNIKGQNIWTVNEIFEFLKLTM